MKLRFRIDEKSLFYGLYNDYERGQTATVSTPINQSLDPAKWRNDIIALYNSGLSADVSGLPSELVKRCLRKTTSQANSKIIHFFNFSTILVDGVKIDCDSEFALYVKEEIDEFITNKKGDRVRNTHLGRQKLHYPISLRFTESGFNINNDSVLNTILKNNGGFAFFVREMECDTNNKSINFITTIVGLEGTPLSSVFKIQKGIGSKTIIGNPDFDGSQLSPEDYKEIMDMAKGDGLNPNNIDFKKLNEAREANGAKGEKFVFDNILNIIDSYITDVEHVSQKFPTAPYDIEYIQNGVKKYIEVKATSGTKKVFYMSAAERMFMLSNKDNYTLILITKVNENVPKVDVYTCNQILSLKQDYPSVRFSE